MKLRLLNLIVLVGLTCNALGQEWYEEWDDNYGEANYSFILEKEKSYAEKVENDTAETQYYVRVDQYRIKGKYLNEKRPILPEVLESIKTVHKFYIGDPSQLDELLESEILVEVDGVKVWMPIQEQLIPYLDDEAQISNEFFFYCLFFNEHEADGTLYNSFLVSEFRYPNFDEQDITLNAKLINYGITSSNLEYTESNPNSPTGTHSFSSDYEIIEKTDTIDSKLGISFGLQFVIESNRDVYVPVTQNWIFPDTISDNNGNKFKSLSYVIEKVTNDTTWVSYKLEDEFELVKGKWIFQAYIEDILIIDKEFYLK